MNAVLKESMNNSLEGELLLNEPMSRHTSWRTGGPADVYYRAANTHDLAAFIKQRFEQHLKGNNHEPHREVNARYIFDQDIVWVGLGSNLLVRDGGIRGAVVATHQSLASLKIVDDLCVEVGAGVPCAKLARTSARHAMKGAEFFAGIPGTVGGALAMNAGAFGSETWDVVESVTTLDVSGRLHTRQASEYDVSYRRAQRAHADNDLREWFLSARLRLLPGDEVVSRNAIRDLLKQRAQSQPIQTFNAGSVFRNPSGGFAAQLIEAAGLKGLRRGGACVSTQHANFIINDDDASSADIEWLITQIRERVAAHSGVMLEPEVRIVGED